MMTQGKQENRNDYWQQTKFSDVMTRNKFEEILAALSFPPSTAPPGTTHDPFRGIKGWLDACNQQWQNLSRLIGSLRDSLGLLGVFVEHLSCEVWAGYPHMSCARRVANRAYFTDFIATWSKEVLHLQARASQIS